MCYNGTVPRKQCVGGAERGEKMKIVKAEELGGENLLVEVVDTYLTRWQDGETFTLYKRARRPSSALFFLLSDVRADYVELDGDGKEVVRIRLKKDDILYIPSGILYRCEFAVPEPTVDRTTCTVNFRLLDRTGDEVLLDRHLCRLKNPVNRYMTEDLLNLHKCSTNPLSNRQQINSIYFSILFYATRARSSDSKTNRIKRAVQAIENEWNRNEKIEKYASLIHMSPAAFYSEFRAYAGMSPVGYRNRIRIMAAQSDLRNTDLSVKEIAEKVGFEDAFYFSRVFRKLTGASPKEFKYRS